MDLARERLQSKSLMPVGVPFQQAEQTHPKPKEWSVYVALLQNVMLAVQFQRVHASSIIYHPDRLAHTACVAKCWVEKTSSMLSAYFRCPLKRESICGNRSVIFNQYYKIWTSNRYSGTLVNDTFRTELRITSARHAFIIFCSTFISIFIVRESSIVRLLWWLWSAAPRCARRGVSCWVLHLHPVVLWKTAPCIPRFDQHWHRGWQGWNILWTIVSNYCDQTIIIDASLVCIPKLFWR